MKSSFLGPIVLGSLAAAQYIQSNPFNLLIQSKSKELNGLALSTCHAGAAIETICLLRDSKAVFTLNTTEGAEPGIGGLAGVLSWELPSQPPIPSSMSLYSEPSTNVALPILSPGTSNPQYVGFDNDLLNIVSTIDDTKAPPMELPRVIMRWYICTSKYASYTYQTLNWSLGKEKPQNPTCVKVDVRRSFV